MRNIYSILPITCLLLLLITSCRPDPGSVEGPPVPQEVDFYALFKERHKSPFDPNSRVDREKMEELKRLYGNPSPVSGNPSPATPSPTPTKKNPNSSLPSEEEVRSALIKRAKTYIGIREINGPNRHPKIDEANRYTGVPLGSAWCASIMALISKEVADELGIKPVYPKTARALTLGKEFSLKTKSPKPGDTFYVGSYSHTGMFEEWSNVGLSTITLEGNTSANAATPGQDREGDGFYRKQRLKASLQYGADWVTNNVEKK